MVREGRFRLAALGLTRLGERVVLSTLLGMSGGHSALHR